MSEFTSLSANEIEGVNLFDNNCEDSRKLLQMIDSHIIWLDSGGEKGDRSSLIDMNRRSSHLALPLRVRAVVNGGWINIEKTKKHSSLISIVLISTVFHDDDIEGLKAECSEYAALQECELFFESYFMRYPFEAKDLLLKRFGTDSISSLHKECYIDLIEAIEDDLIKK